MKDYGMAMEFDTMEVWNKLSGGKPLSDYPTYDNATDFSDNDNNLKRLQNLVAKILENGKL